MIFELTLLCFRSSTHSMPHILFSFSFVIFLIEVLVKYRKRKGSSEQKDTKSYTANIISKSQYGQFQVQFEKSGVQTWVLKRYLEKVTKLL